MINAHINIEEGSLWHDLVALDRSTVRIAGGELRGLQIEGEARVDISGGLLANQVVLRGRAQGTFSGGAFAGGLSLSDNAFLQIQGGEFRIDGVVVTGLETPGTQVDLSLGQGQVLSGTLADGTPFGFEQTTDPGSAVVRLQSSSLQVAAPQVIVPGDHAPVGIREGQTLLVRQGGYVPSHFIAGWGSSIVIAGGRLASNPRLFGTTLTMSAGELGRQTRAVHSVLTISGGSARELTLVDSSAHVSGGSLSQLILQDKSELTISGGRVASLDAGPATRLNMEGGSLVGTIVLREATQTAITGGILSGGIALYGSSTIDVSGGVLAAGWRTTPGAEVQISGGEFRIDGSPLSLPDDIGDTLELDLGDATLSGVLADGTPFHLANSKFAPGTLKVKRAAIPAAMPGTTVIAEPFERNQLRRGERLVISSGGSVAEYFRAQYATNLVVEGGSVGNYFEGGETSVILNSGIIGDYFRGHVRTRLELHRGVIGVSALLSGESHLEMTGGTLGSTFSLTRGSTANITGGTVGDGFAVTTGSKINVHGGTFGSGFQVGTRSNPGRGTEGGDPTTIEVPLLSVANIYGGTFGNGLAANKTGVVNVYGGQLADSQVEEGKMNLYGGRLGINTRVYLRGSLDIYGGSATNLHVSDRGTLNVFGGHIEGALNVNGSGYYIPAVANIFAGRLHSSVTVQRSSVLNIYGGQFDEAFSVNAEGQITLHGTHFVLDGEQPLSLEPNIPYLLTTRDATLTATLADGSPFELGLFTTAIDGRDFVHTGASLYLVLVQIPEPATITLALLALSCLPLRRRLLNR